MRMRTNADGGVTIARDYLISGREMRVLVELLRSAATEGRLTQDQLAALSSDPEDMVRDLLPDNVTIHEAIVLTEEHFTPAAWAARRRRGEEIRAAARAARNEEETARAARHD